MDLFILIFWLLFVTGTFLPETGNDFWLIRGQDYFKSFYMAFNLLIIPLLWSLDYPQWVLWLLSISSVCSAAYAFLIIERFTRLSPKRVPDAENPDPENSISIYISNVYQYNRAYSRTLGQINELKPDLVFLLETDPGWDSAVHEIRKDYAYEIKEIRDDTYGLLLLSKLPLENPEILYRVKKDVPSVETSVRLNGKQIKIIGLHPKPPVPGEALFATKKDRELMLTALSIVNSKETYHLLIGDLNDVAWSSINRRFKRVTGMKDPRQGRGFFATFPTWSPLKIPLDHVFCSPAFHLVEFMLAENTGSDHFPVFVKFELNS